MNTKMTNLIKVTAGIGIVVGAYAIGAGIIPITFDLPNQTENVVVAAPVRTGHSPTVEAKLVETRTVEYVKDTTVQTRYVDVVQEVPATHRNFTTLDEMQNWVNKTISTATIRFETEDSIIDCDDYAVEMQQKALDEGYIVSFQIISRADYNGLFAIQLPEGQSLHAINLAIIGNSVFYIEPQTGEIVHAAYLD